MSIVASHLIARVSVEGVEASQAKLAAMGKTSDEVGKKLNEGLKFAVLGGGAALLGIGFAATKMAGDFQAGVTTLVTGAGEFEKNVGLISAGLLKMSVATGTSTTELTKGLYMIESAGFHGASGLAVLQAAAEGAKVGEASLADVANGVTTIMVDYASKHITAAQATNILIAAVAAGKTHMQDLATALSTILPTSAAVHVSMIDTAAALATMTSEGTDAASAATYLRQMLLAMEVPGSKAQKVFKEIGLTTADVASGMRKSLPATLQLIEEHLALKFPESAALTVAEMAKVRKGQETMDQAMANLTDHASPAYVAALKDIAGGQKNFQAWLELTGGHLATFKADVVDITDKVQKGGNAVTGWSLVQKDFNFKLEQAHAALNVFLIQLGTSLLPLVSELIAYFTAQLLPRLSDFSLWFQQQGVPALQSFGSTLGPLVTDLINFAQWLGQGSAPAKALTIAALGLGSAIALVKIGNLVGDMLTFIANAPAMVSKLLFVQGAATGAAGSVASIGVAAETSAGEVGLSSVAEEGSLAKVALAGDAAATGIKGIGLTASGAALLLAPLVLAMKWLIDNHQAIIDAGTGVKGLGSDMPGANDPNNPSGISFQNPFAPNGAYAVIDAHNKEVAAAAKKAAAETGKFLTYTEALYQKWLASLRAGNITSYADFKAADDKKTEVFLANQQKFRASAAQTEARLIALNGPYKPVIDTTAIAIAKAEADHTRTHLELLNGPFAPIVNTASIHNVLSTADQARRHLLALNGSSSWTANVTTVTSNVILPSRHFASGTQDYPGGVGLVGEYGPELVNLPRGSTITPAGPTQAMLSGGGSGGSKQPVIINVSIAGRNVGHALLPDLVSAVRNANGSINI